MVTAEVAPWPMVASGLKLGTRIVGRPKEGPAMPENDYRLILFDAPDDPGALRDLFKGVMGLHPTEAMQWVRRAPGIMPWPLAEGEVRELLDALYEQGVAAEARRIDTVPKLIPARPVHIASIKEDGLSIGGLRGEPAHWVPLGDAGTDPRRPDRRRR